MSLTRSGMVSIPSVYAPGEKDDTVRGAGGFIKGFCVFKKLALFLIAEILIQPPSVTGGRQHTGYARVYMTFLPFISDERFLLYYYFSLFILIKGNIICMI